MWRDDVGPEVEHLVGLDLAQSGAAGADFTALSVIERTEPVDGSPARYHVMHLERWRDRRTARIPERVTAVERQLMALHRQREFERTGSLGPDTPELVWRLVVDITGVGGFGADPLRQAGFEPTGIQIHGGDAVSHPDPHTYRVPKRDLAGVLDVCLEQGRLTIAEALPDAATLRAELENFRVKININTGHDSYEAGPRRRVARGRAGRSSPARCHCRLARGVTTDPAA
jgi:hypothetical protein